MSAPTPLRTEAELSPGITPRIEIDFGGGWVDVSEDVISGIKCEWGIHGSSPNDRVADPGTLAFTLDNDQPSHDVYWIEQVGVVQVGRQLTMTSGAGTWGSGGAISDRSLPAGNGYLEFSTGTGGTAYSRMCGLGTGNDSAHFNDIEFAIFIRNDGVFLVYESGTSRGSFGSYGLGDSFRVEVDSQVEPAVVRYYYKAAATKTWGAAFYTSALEPTFPLHPDCAFLTQNGTISNAILVDTSSLTYMPRRYYTPGFSRAHSGFRVGAPVRLRLEHATLGSHVRWVGTVSDAKPVAGRRPVTNVTCVDWMEEAARARLDGLSVQTDVQADTLFSLLVSSVKKGPPGGSQAGTGADVFPFALDNTQDESGRVLGEFQRLAMSEFGLVYVEAGKAIFEGRKARAVVPRAYVALDDGENIVKLPATHDRGEIINRVQVSIHPRRRDAAATTVLFNLGASVEVLRNTSVTIQCPYRDPNQQAQRVGGIDMVAPVASTDYTLNAKADGTGVDLTAQLDVVATFGGNSASVTLTNNGPADGFVPPNGLQLRGRGLYDFEPVLADRGDAASQDDYGENVAGYDMPYQSSPVNASEMAAFLLNSLKDPRTNVQSVTFIAQWSDATLDAAFYVGVSSVVSVTSTALGMSSVNFWVNGVRLDIAPSGLTQITLDLALASDFALWQLGVQGASELGDTTRLGYGLFAVGWILGSSELGADTFLN